MFGRLQITSADFEVAEFFQIIETFEMIVIIEICCGWLRNLDQVDCWPGGQVAGETRTKASSVLGMLKTELELVIQKFYLLFNYHGRIKQFLQNMEHKT